MVLLVQKLSRSLKPDALSPPLHGFRSKISNHINQILLKPEPGQEFMSLAWFHKCFNLINITNRAFANLVVEIDYPMTQWSFKATDEYLTYTFYLLNLLNSINANISHLSQSQLLISHALALIKNSPTSAAKHLNKITPRKNMTKEYKFETPIFEIELKTKTSNPEKERVVLQALTVLKKIGFLVLGIVLSGLCGDNKPYMEIRKSAGGYEDSLTKGLDSRFCKEMVETLEEVKEVNCAAESLYVAICNGRYTEAVGELRRRLEVLGNSIQGIEKQVNTLFSEVLGTRNKLIDNLRLTGHNH